MRFLCKTNNAQSITANITLVVMLLLFLLSCGKEKTEVVEVVFDPETTYTMKATDITELISDSGVIRYKIIAKEWYVYDKAEEPYWLFPKGAYLERFDSLFNKDASIKADTIYRYVKKDLWELIGNVKVLSLKGEKFDTDHLFWDQKAGRFYSDEYIRVEREDKIITGIGFESNQDMTKYNVFDSQAILPVNEMASDTTTEVADSTLVLPVD
ncbi:LPS export ABC transporter periplasmic protein LptC [Massilibacteroides sp.]|uniref:LPS export ABC transporter periplasmic protein LptC n=1 Tax=Massilibacteroides sp. TaxID=2034766 RepID=UPI00261ECE3C|nr:LPS export ABC transporter periplasmic protein LptC [Massilibacteroides sp.]MDD4514137.1 LPS export ABC transporter periplasmic protein LptC [Massilibacteroides sp.]